MGTADYICDVVIFGGHGNLAFRKLMPALYHLSHDGHISLQSRIISVIRKIIVSFFPQRL